jgi:GNAT superfamily N-acetyltransferase
MSVPIDPTARGGFIPPPSTPKLPDEDDPVDEASRSGLRSDAIELSSRPSTVGAGPSQIPRPESNDRLRAYAQHLAAEAAAIANDRTLQRLAGVKAPLPFGELAPHLQDALIDEMSRHFHGLLPSEHATPQSLITKIRLRTQADDPSVVFLVQHDAEHKLVSTAKIIGAEPSHAVGTLAGDGDPHCAHLIADVFTVRSYRGHGFAKVNIQSLCDIAHANGWPALHLHCRKNLVDFYRSQKFELMGKVTVKGMDEYVMRISTAPDTGPPRAKL